VRYANQAVKTVVLALVLLLAGCAPGSGSESPDRLSVNLGGGIRMEFVWIRPGTFTMGSPLTEQARDPDETPHQVTLTAGFWIGRYEVTQAQWQAVMGKNPARFRKKSGPNAPVEQISWDECREFMRRLSALLPAERKLTARFPTEAEWEYACRAGTSTPFHYGQRLDASMANFDGGFPYGTDEEGVFREKTVPVGSFKPNAWGLYDMHGNVWEWCADWYDKDYYKQSPAVDPQGPDSGEARVLRGGSWLHAATDCRAAWRNSFNTKPGRRNASRDIGLRVVVATAR